MPVQTTIEVEREVDGILYYISVSISESEDEMDARVAEDIPEYEITGHERQTGQAVQELTGALAFAAGDEIELDDREERRAREFSIGDFRFSNGLPRHASPRPLRPPAPHARPA